MRQNINFLLTSVFLFALIFEGLAQSSTGFLISSGHDQVTLLYDKNEDKTVKIAVNALADDIQLITGHRPVVSNNVNDTRGSVIVIGTYGQSNLFKEVFLPEGQVPKGWETYSFTFQEDLNDEISNALFICGSDKRGTAYGVFDLSKKLGVSPWYWWADVTPEKRNELSVEASDFISNEPSVKYRGIFLNDEGWGLNPWASNNFEPEEGNIGPRTYAKIFELLLRLKANFIWPAMHPCTNAFYKNPDNPKVASDYGIVVGSSHAEPMLRNNVDEWNKSSMGDFNFIDNRETVLNYWEERVKESSDYPSIYTLGMRGIHDSGMEGVGSREEQVEVLEEIISEQRDMLKKHVNPDVTEVPQAFTAYKEVLDIYDSGMQLSEDITLVWPDDNYGYIKRLSNEEERARIGGSGIYYHLSYWGRPHDYLWLSSTHPSLIREEMMKAAAFQSREIWVANVGDIKPAEHNLSLFLDMAYNIDKYEESLSEKEQLRNWMNSIFGETVGEEAAEVLWKYYDLNFERRPEFMGWSQVEPIRKTHFSEYKHFDAGDEAQNRIDAFNNLTSRVRELRGSVPDHLDDAFYQLVYYPVICAGHINKKFLYMEKAYKYAAQGRASANDFADMAHTAYDSILLETRYYNKELAGGKWKGMMDYAPRSLPVFEEPIIPRWDFPGENSWALAVEGDEEIRQNSHIKGPLSLSRFSSWLDQSHFIDIFLNNTDRIAWEAIPSEDWIKVSPASGVLDNGFGNKQVRVHVQIDAEKMPGEKYLRGNVEFRGSDGKELSIGIDAINYSDLMSEDIPKIVEHDGYVSVFAENYSRIRNEGHLSWEPFEGLGYTGKSLWVNPLNYNEKEMGGQEKTVVEYDFFSHSDGEIEVHVYCIPVHPLNKSFGNQLGISINEENAEVVTHKTYGRSEEWKLNVLRNSAKVTSKHKLNSAGKKTLKIQAIDPGVIIDRIEIDFGGLPDVYSVLPETRITD